MDHIATALDLEPISVRRINFSEEYSAILESILKDALLSSEYENRLSAVNEFNKVSNKLIIDQIIYIKGNPYQVPIVPSLTTILRREYLIK